MRPRLGAPVGSQFGRQITGVRDVACVARASRPWEVTARMAVPRQTETPPALPLTRPRGTAKVKVRPASPFRAVRGATERRSNLSVPSIQLGQLWKFTETGDTWLVTKVYSEVFTSYAVLRKVGGGDNDVRRVKVEKITGGISLSGFVFAQESDAF